ncbi:MAG: CoA pyrophosphatase [Deltaproteobacteria bacterium]|nr:CoA pyrophosphatase [Deltaproteobacteria bacterium]
MPPLVAKHFDLQTLTDVLDQRQPATIEAARRAAVAIILRSNADQIAELLFIQRAEHPEDPWSGHMAFPGGRLEASDRDPRHGAARETREEIGLDLSNGAARFLGYLDDVQVHAKGAPVDMAITPCVFELLETPQAFTPNQEVQSTHWFSARALTDADNHQLMNYNYRGTNLHLSSVVIDGQRIWGLTFRMLQSFFELLR